MDKYLVHSCEGKIYLITSQDESLGWYVHLKEFNAATEGLLYFDTESWEFSYSLEQELINDGNPLVSKNVFEGTLKEIYDWIKLNKMLE